MPIHVLALIAAIVSEVIATMALQASAQFTRTLPTVVMIIGYATSFFFLSHALKIIPVGVAYAVWSGVGVVLIVIFGRIVFGQKLDFAAFAGIGLIVAGVVVLQLFSDTNSHG